MTVIGSLLASTSGALVAVQVGLWVAGRYARAVPVSQSTWASVFLSAGLLLLGIVTFFVALLLLAQTHRTSYGRRSMVWAGVGFVAMTGWAFGVPLLLAA